MNQPMNPSQPISRLMGVATIKENNAGEFPR